MYLRGNVVDRITAIYGPFYLHPQDAEITREFILVGDTQEDDVIALRSVIYKERKI